MTRRWIAVLVLSPAAYTAAALAITTANRDTDRAVMALSEREAPAPPRNDDNSMLRLRLAWQPAPFDAAGWFDREKLREVGFDVNVDPAASDAERHYRRVLPRRAYVAFELAGPAWEKLLAARENAEPRKAGVPREQLREYGSRLVPVDVAADAATLAQRYPEGGTYLITAATVGLSWMKPDGGIPYVAGHIVNIDPDRLYVPRALARQLPLPTRFDTSHIPYTVTVAYGSRWEPFVTAVSRGDASR